MLQKTCWLMWLISIWGLGHSTSAFSCSGQAQQNAENTAAISDDFWNPKSLWVMSWSITILSCGEKKKCKNIFNYCSGIGCQFRVAFLSVLSIFDTATVKKKRLRAHDQIETDLKNGTHYHQCLTTLFEMAHRNTLWYYQFIYITFLLSTSCMRCC